MNAWRLFAASRKLVRLGRGVRLRVWGAIWGASIGPWVEVEKGLLVRWAPHSGLTIGKGVYIGKGVILDVPRNAKLFVGDFSKIMHGTVIAASAEITLGRFCQVAEYCSIRDSDHDLGSFGPMVHAPLVSGTVHIGNDVWIGRGAAVIRGADVGDGAVIGANAVARTPIPERAVAVGVPARVVRTRGMDG